MQHDALESISSTLKLTGVTFPAVSLPPRSTKQNKVNIFPRSLISKGLDAFKDCLRVAHSHQTAANMLCQRESNTFPWAAGMAKALNSKLDLIPRRRYQAGGALPVASTGNRGKALAHA